MRFFELIAPNTNIEFVKNWRWFVTGSVVLILIGVVSMAVQGLNLGVDFKGGTKVVVSFKGTDPVNRDDIRSAIQAMLSEKTGDAAPQVEVQDLVAGVTSGDRVSYAVYTEVVTPLKQEDKDAIVKALQEKFGEKTVVMPPEESGNSFFVTFETESNIEQRNKEIADVATKAGLKKVRVESDKQRDLSMEMLREKNMEAEEVSDLERAAAEVEADEAREKRKAEFIKTNTDTSFTIQFEELAPAIEDAVKSNAALADRFLAVESSSTISASVGSDMLNQGLLALLYACLGILLYLALRFDFKYGPGAVIALMHDSLITIGIFSLFQIPFSMPIIAAVMTIIGYSVNDTIVVFDRIRENLGKLKGLPFDRIVNKSINETLSRTLLTVGTTLLTVIAIFALGGGLIRDFAFALLIGFVVGTYSSIYIASPIVMVIEGILSRRQNAPRNTTSAA